VTFSRHPLYWPQRSEKQGAVVGPGGDQEKATTIVARDWVEIMGAGLLLYSLLFFVSGFGEVAEFGISG
jgi:hypothetical protein